ncbi:MAG: DUF5723 family protein [Bacteroidota bacterium]|nr:DUF5723 family protein [Bacteroidota bacterium]
MANHSASYHSLRRKVSYCLIALLVILGSIFPAFSQEMLGISNSNFAGNMGMSLNPSLFVGSPYRHEFNLISGDLFIDNDFVYLQKRSSTLVNSINGEPIPEERFKNYTTTTPKKVYGNVFLRGPSYIQNKDRFSWGVHTAFRGNLSATDVPFHLAKFIKEGFDYIPQHDINFISTPFKSTTMAWGEIGGTYGRKLYERREKGYLAGAVTLKFLIGFDAAFADLSEFDYEVPSSDTLVVNTVTGTYGHSLTDDEKGFNKPLKFRGFGGGIDIGITYYRGKIHGAGDCNATAEIRKKYKYRLGISIIDIGFVRFSKQAKVFEFNNNSAIWPGIDTVNFSTIMTMDTTISGHFYGDPYASQTDAAFSIYTPTALSVQFDYCIIPRIYVNASIIQAIPLSKLSIVRASQFSITPRFETRKFEVALPITLYEYKTPHVGIAVRYKFLVLGTERLGSFTGLWNTTGYDIYFGLKFNVCQLKKKGGKDSFCPVD